MSSDVSFERRLRYQDMAIARLMSETHLLRDQNAELAAQLEAARNPAPDAAGDRLEATLPAGPGGPAIARAALTRWLTGQVRGEDLSDARLLASELVANSVGTERPREEPLWLAAQLHDGALRVEVRDPGGAASARLELGGGSACSSSRRSPAVGHRPRGRDTSVVRECCGMSDSPPSVTSPGWMSSSARSHPTPFADLRAGPWRPISARSSRQCGLDRGGHFTPGHWMRGIYADGQPVGFVFTFDDRSEGHFLWRIMIAEGHQRRGVGRRAMQRVLEHWRELGAPRRGRAWCRRTPARPTSTIARLPAHGEEEHGELVMTLELDSQRLDGCGRGTRRRRCDLRTSWCRSVATGCARGGGRGRCSGRRRTRTGGRARRRRCCRPSPSRSRRRPAIERRVAGAAWMCQSSPSWRTNCGSAWPRRASR